MSKIDTNTVREKVVTMMGDLREVVDLYMRNEAEVAVVEGNHTFSREYKDTQIENLREKARASVRNKFDSLRSNCEMLIEVLRANDNIYDFSDPEFASCIALLSAADKPLPMETILGIAGKFLGNRQALLALVEVAKGTNKDTFSKMIFNTESSEVPFINYAAFWIRQVMRRYIDNCGRVVRIPTHAVDKMQHYKKTKSEYQKYYGKIPTDREMSAFMGMDEESLKSIKKTAAMGQIRSLDEPINSDEEDIYIGDTIASKEDVEADVIDRIDSDRMSRELWTAVDRLPDLQGKVLRCRFLEKKTYQQTGETLGISVSAVRQQQDKAMRVLRNTGRNKGFIGYREEFLPAASIHHVGVRSFQHTWTSEVEREVLRF